MELTAGFPFWLIKDGLLFHYPKLTVDKQAEGVIIGGGISGALAAYYLSREGISCILVDGRSIGLGSTCASTSLLQYELDTPLHVLSGKKGKKTAVRSFQLCGEAIEKLVRLMETTGYKEYEHNPSLLFSTHRREKDFIKKEYKARKEAGFDVSFLTSGEMKTMYGLKAAYGILSATGATINTYSLTHHLLQEALKEGLQVYDRTRITGITSEKGGMKLVTADGFHITSSFVVNATGYEVVNFIGKRIVNFDCTYAIASEQQPEREQHWKDGTMFWNTDDPYLYMRLTKDNRILAGGRDEAFSTRVTRQLFLEKKSAGLEKDVKEVFPGIDFKTEFAWSGTFGKTRDSLPYIGTCSKTPGVYYALGFGGNGITFSVVAAEMICDMVKGRENKDAPLFSFDR